MIHAQFIVYGGNGGFFMGVIDKIEDLVFQSRTLASVEIVKNKMVVVKMRCIIAHLSDSECHLLGTRGIKYKVLGDALQVKEYGDTYVKIEGTRITGFLIEGGASDE